MKHLQLRTLNKLYFGYADIARALGVSPASAKVTAHRYTKSGFLIRVKRNIYVLSERWRSIDREEQFIIANIVQVPSYISLMTALDYYEITTQMQRGFIESVATKRTVVKEIKKTVFNYAKIRADLYYGFLKSRGFFIAQPEKAFLDAAYLMSLGRYDLDLSSIDFTKLDWGKLNRMARSFPLKTRNWLKKNEYLRKARSS
jgi:hypothetical protein